MIISLPPRSASRDNRQAACRRRAVSLIKKTVLTSFALTTISRTMHAFRHIARLTSYGFVVMCAFTLHGCATTEMTPERSDEAGGVFATNETSDVALEVRGEFDRAMSHLNAGNYSEGAKLLHAVMQRSPRHVASHINLAIAYQRLNNLAAAEESIKKALELHPEHPVANTEYGLIFRKTGRFAEARQAYERTLRRHPTFLPARKNLGILCDVYVRDLDCALDHYRIYSSAAPHDDAVRIWIADLERRLKQGQ
jgi:Tfp pilus assembly protein PilF